MIIKLINLQESSVKKCMINSPHGPNLLLMEVLPNTNNVTEGWY